MPIVNFIYMKNKYSAKLDKRNIIKYEIFEDYANILGKHLDQLRFTYNGKYINLNNRSDFSLNIKKNKIIIFVFSLTKNINKEPYFITCPKCRNLVQLKINEDKISLDNCFRRHCYADLTIEEFAYSQNIEEFNVKCELCGNNKNYYDKLYVCSCEKIICPLCILSHNVTHSIINYDNRFYQCNKHSMDYVSYCLNCYINLCPSCEKDHSRHKVTYFKSIKPNEKKVMEIRKEFKDFELRAEKYKTELIKLNEIYSDFIINIINNLDEYLKLNEFMINCLDNFRNFENIKNVLNFRTKKLNKDIYVFLSESSSKNRFRFLLDLFDNPKNEMSIEYFINNSDETKIRLFGDKFVKTNKKNCFLIIDGKKFELKEYYNFQEKPCISDTIKVYLVEKRKILNMSYMFSECNNLLNFDISKYDTSNINNMSGMFSDCNQLEFIPHDLSKFNVFNIFNMSYLFYNCEQLKRIPDISRWETANVLNISHMFNKCSSLVQLPDISKWYINKVKDVSAIFNECSSLKSLPEISKWETRNITSMSGMFNKCSNLTQLPDISKWNVQKVKDMSAMFQNCSSLK